MAKESPTPKLATAFGFDLVSRKVKKKDISFENCSWPQATPSDMVTCSSVVMSANYWCNQDQDQKRCAQFCKNSLLPRQFNWSSLDKEGTPSCASFKITVSEKQVLVLLNKSLLVLVICKELVKSNLRCI